jgi:hypothetical protein
VGNARWCGGGGGGWEPSADKAPRPRTDFGWVPRIPSTLCSSSWNRRVDRILTTHGVPSLRAATTRAVSDSTTRTLFVGSSKASRARPRRNVPCVSRSSPDAVRATTEGIHGRRGVFARCQRSVLVHPVGLPLAWFVRGTTPGCCGGAGAKDRSQHDAHDGANLARRFPRFAPPLLSVPGLYEASDPRSYRNVLEASISSWTSLPGAMRSEPSSLANIVGARIRDATLKAEDSQDNLLVLSQARIPDTPPTGEKTGHADPLLLVCEKHNRRSTDGAQVHPLEARLLVNVGLKHDEWWKKFDQAVMHVNGMDQNLVGALLVAVVTVQAKHDDDAAPRGAFESGRIGLFLATPPGKGTEAPPERRISLLWHTETESLRSLSDAFGRALFASTRLLPEWLEASQQMMDRGEYRSLGPHCCRIKDEVRVASCRMLPLLCGKSINCSNLNLSSL